MAYYAQVQATLLREGLLRSDPGSEIPVTPEILAQNFLKVALFDEYRRDATGFVPQETESRLRRWVVPIRVAVRFRPQRSCRPPRHRPRPDCQPDLTGCRGSPGIR
jgi:hypothetical protein